MVVLADLSARFGCQISRILFFKIFLPFQDGFHWGSPLILLPALSSTIIVPIHILIQIQLQGLRIRVTLNFRIIQG
jgi:hypothetical protein